MASSSLPKRRAPHQLPAGRHGLSATFVVDNQRRRMLDAVVASVAEHGYGALTIEQVVAGAGVSRRTFYDHFPNKEDVFIAAYDRIVDRLFESVATAYESGDTWIDRMHQGLGMFLDVLGSDPALAHVCVVDILAAGPRGIARRTDAMARFRDFFVPAEAAADRVMSPFAAEAAIGGAYEVVYGQILAGRAALLPQLLPDLLHTILLPFVGAEAAEAEYLTAQHRIHPGAAPG